jgi:predicted anti-sigma-YlaC factor YlaD
VVGQLQPGVVWPLGRWLSVGAGEQSFIVQKLQQTLALAWSMHLAPLLLTSAGKAWAPGAVGLLAWAMLCQRLSVAILGGT